MPIPDQVQDMLFRDHALDQPQSLESGMAFLADDDVVVHGNAERFRHIDDGLRHLDVGARRRRIARRMVVQDTFCQVTILILFNVLGIFRRQGARIGGGKLCRIAMIPLS